MLRLSGKKLLDYEESSERHATTRVEKVLFTMQRAQSSQRGTLMARTSSRRNPTSVSQQAAARTSPVRFLKEVIEELKKSVWPSKEETARLTAVVITLAVIIGFLLGGLDRVFSEVLPRFVF